ncbi:MAG: hypothetical protein ABSB26_06060 [Nitrososphaerales archaeon]
MDDMGLRMVWFAVGVIFLLGTSAVYAAPPSKVLGGSTPYSTPPSSAFGGNVAHLAQSQTVSLNLTGGVVSPGVQSYSLRGGQLVAAWIFGTPVNSMNSILRYDLSAVVSGLTATGTASFDLKTKTSHWSYTDVKGTVEIDSMTPAVLFPLGCTPYLNCTSAIPALFNGTGTVTISTGSGVTTMSLSMGFESAYLNPFGGPVFFVSNSSEVFVIADYSHAEIQWTGVQMGGAAAGTFGGTPVSGSFGMLVNSSEDLSTGREVDQGAIYFLGMSNPALNGLGTFIGHSTIPTGSSVACPGFPAGTCNLTGLKSSGAFTMTLESGGVLSGRYTTVWATPAVVFSSNISASTRGHHGHR